MKKKIAQIIVLLVGIVLTLGWALPIIISSRFIPAPVMVIILGVIFYWLYIFIELVFKKMTATKDEDGNDRE